MPKLLPEVFVSNAAIASHVSKELRRGRLRKLGSRVYTTNLKEQKEVLTRRHAWFIVEALFPGSVVVDRTALEHRPATDGSIFIVSKKKRPVRLPGLSIYPRKGHGPLEEDRPFMEHLYLSCPARAYLENLRATRTRKRKVARVLSRKELEERLETLYQSAGNASLQSLRDEAKKIAPQLGLHREFKELDSLIGSLLGTRQAPLTSPLAMARALGIPYDAKRLDRFQQLYEALSTQAFPFRPAQLSSTALPFFEAYFSNFIEGTEFAVEEAIEIIFEGKISIERPADAHDILGTYQVTADEREMRQVPQDADAMIAILKRRHAYLMQGRPEANPGRFKTIANRAGSTLFVAPELVEGTLRKGFQWLSGLSHPFQKAVYMMFLIAEVHPFVDGNGRTARLMMNAELVAANQMRIIIPTIFRNNYLASLKSMTHNGQAEPLIRTLAFAQEYAHRIDWSDLKRAQAMLTSTHAFDDPNDADRLGIRLVLPQ